MMKYFCCDDRRREAVQAHGSLHGIDFLEVLDDPSVPNDQRQRTMFVHFIKDLSSPPLTPDNIRIDGGERIRNVTVTNVTVGTGDQSNVLTVEVDKAGDFSIYTLRLVQGPQHAQPPDGFDPILSAVDFSFKVECPSDFDCKSKRVCPPEALPQPEINYLAKDYASFRRLMLDRMAVLMPQWKERIPADLGVALVELLAYVGDYLSYQQDAVGTEAYLGTARRRVSVRRHARLVDYFMHDGCNARAWVQVLVNADDVMMVKGAQLLTRIAGQPVRIPPNSAAHAQALALRPEVFETLHSAVLYKAHNEMSFYTWGNERCCLPKGATKATLRDDETNRLRLCPGDVLIFKERLDPGSGQEADADPTRRHAVRLTRVSPQANVEQNGSRTPGNLFADPLFEQPIVEIEWDPEDALPFPLCVSATINTEDNQEYFEDVSIALGNIVLADHGLTVSEEALGSVPPPRLFRPPPPGGDPCAVPQAEPVPPRFRPHLEHRPLTHAAPDLFEKDESGQLASATTAMQYSPHDALPEIFLKTVPDEHMPPWYPKRDLINSGPLDRHFVVEVEANGTVFLRFGDDRFGMRPAADTTCSATYRVGNGVRGNVGAEAIAHIVSNDAGLENVRNPMPARGGVEPESIEDVRKNAPSAFRTQERAVTSADYAEVTERHPQVQRAAATFRWTGSWHTVFVTVDRMGGLPVDNAFEDKMRRHIERYRMAGHDMEVDVPRFVPLEIEMRLCVKPDYFRSDVKEALLQVFSNRVLADGQRGVFHPDNFSLGQPVYLSHLYGAALAVEGVASVQATRFQRCDAPSAGALEAARLSFGRLEIARLDNDPNYPEHGVFHVSAEGGK